MDAAAWWAGGGRSTEAPKAHISTEFAEEMRAFGLEDEIADVPIESDKEAATAETFEVYRENWLTVQVFQAMGRQWEHLALADGTTIRTRMIYEALPTVVNMTKGLQYRRNRWPALLQDLRIMEEAALKVFKARRDKQLQEIDSRT